MILLVLNLIVLNLILTRLAQRPLFPVTRFSGPEFLVVQCLTQGRIFADDALQVYGTGHGV